LRRDLPRFTRVRASVPALDQFALAYLIEQGELDRHVRQMHCRYKQRSVELRRLLADAAPWLLVSDGSAGLHVMAQLAKPDLDEATALAAATAASVGLSIHHRSVTAGHRLAIGFSRPPERRFRTALERLGDVLAGILHRGQSSARTLSLGTSEVERVQLVCSRLRHTTMS
jgi:DNA-binding transcriptional MocR family regulator